MCKTVFFFFLFVALRFYTYIHNYQGKEGFLIDTVRKGSRKRLRGYFWSYEGGDEMLRCGFVVVGSGLFRMLRFVSWSSGNFVILLFAGFFSSDLSYTFTLRYVQYRGFLLLRSWGCIRRGRERNLREIVRCNYEV